MTDEKIIEYVMDSPENTNPSVLDSMLKSNKVQPDWNQNDLTASDYIKNKPFYEEVTNVAMLPETKFNFGIELTDMTLISSFPYTFNVGQEYTVTFDGETKVTQAVDDNGTVSIFTASLEEFYSGTGYKLFVYQGKLQLATKAFDLAEHTIGLIGKSSVVHKIDDKYLGDVPFKMDKENPTGTGTFSLNRKVDTYIGPESFAEGLNGTASGIASHAEGLGTTASGDSSHSEGLGTTASGEKSHAEGESTVASGEKSHAEGWHAVASGNSSHAEGSYTIASSVLQHVQGQWNIEDSAGVYAHIIGNGNNHVRKNIHTVDWNGNAWYDGNIEGKALIIASSTAGSTKRFKVTVDDTGTLTATEVTS